jgi:hypothetical protein
MGATPGRYRSNTIAIPWRHHSDTGPGVGSSAGRASRGPTHPDALETPPCTAIVQVVRRLRRSCRLQVAGCKLTERVGDQPATSNLQPATGSTAALVAAWPRCGGVLRLHLPSGSVAYAAYS